MSKIIVVPHNDQISFAVEFVLEDEMFPAHVKITDATGICKDELWFFTRSAVVSLHNGAIYHGRYFRVNTEENTIKRLDSLPGNKAICENEAVHPELAKFEFWMIHTNGFAGIIVSHDDEHYTLINWTTGSDEVDHLAGEYDNYQIIIE